MARASNGDTVKVSYTGILNDGTVFDKSNSPEHFEFTIGNKMVINGFDNAVIGMKLNETKSVTIPSKEAYGERLEDNIGTIKRSMIPESMRLEIGQVFELQDENDNRFEVRVIDFNDSEVIIDANHRLAGKDLTFKITLKEIIKKV
ncbi:MAG: FKBP-type peptidyl-prolyl cis-trans isomerase [Chitinispirillia bacterium]